MHHSHHPLSKLNDRLEAYRDKSAQRPFRSSLPFLGLSGLILSGAVLAFSCTLCYTVDIQGQKVSYFEGGAEAYQQALDQAEARASRILDTNYSFDQEVSVRTTLAPRTQVQEPPQVADSLLEAIPELEHVYTLTVDGVQIGAAQEDETIQEALSLVKDHYTTPETRSITVDSHVNLRYEYLPAETGTLTAQELADKLLDEIPQTFPYTVQPGDTLEGLLDRFAMTQERLQELNPEVTLEADPLAMGIELEGSQLDEADLAEAWAAAFGTPLETGLVLTIEQTCPRLVVSTVEEQTVTRPANPAIETQADPTMFVGQQRIVQEGTPGEAEVLARVVKRSGVTIASTDLTANATTEALPVIVGTGTQPMPQLPDGCLFLWPVRGVITSDYGYRFIFGETNFHRGVDIAAPMGTAINAAADGTVIFAGVRGTYGNLVIVSHQNGFVTYYAHCSQLLVSAGETVTQGQPVAAVGSTGRSTGPHLHFEVRYQNSPIDPLLYLPGTNNAPAREEITPEEEAVPETPAEPEIPETPVTPEIPAVPEAPVDPEAPAGPEPSPEEETPTPEAALPPESKAGEVTE